MGSHSSKSEKFGNRSFSESENKYLEDIFERLVAGEDKNSFSKSHLVKYLPSSLPSDVTSHLFSYMKSVGSSNVKQKGAASGEVAPDEFLVALARALKGDIEETSSAITFLASGNDESATLHDIWQLFYSLIRASLSGPQPAAVNSWKLNDDSTKLYVNFLLHDLVYSDGKQQCDVTSPLPMTTTFSAYNVEQWLQRSQSAQHVFHCSFHRCFPTDDVSRLPSLVPACRLSAKPPFAVSELLDLASVAFLDRCLPHELRGIWRPLFSSSKQGESFNALVRSIVDHGPCVLVIKDRDGCVFGGFVATSWTFCSQFAGSPYCFLFTLSPTMDVYFQSGMNANYMYLNQNQQTLPNGLAMGGQFGYFGLWLDPEYGKGHSMAQPKCTTYHSPQLSGQQNFQIHTLEAWAVGPESKGSDAADGEDAKPKTILDKDSTAKAMMKLIDKGTASDAIREVDDRTK